MSHRIQLEEVRSDNRALQERLSILQHEVQNLEEDISKKRRVEPHLLRQAVDALDLEPVLVPSPKRRAGL